MLKVKISTNSALMLGSGTGRGSFIDGDIIFDDYGLPLFPGRRLKGLLKESAMEVVEMFEKCNMGHLFKDDIIEIVFGTSTSPAGIRVDNLYLTDSQETDYKTIVQWLCYIDDKYFNLANKEAVINALTQIRQQTAINTEGYVKENSLRIMRVLNPNKEFVGTIEVLRKNRQTEIEALLALACSNLKRVGTGRNRGWGEIECSLYTDDGNNLNVQVLNDLRNYNNESDFSWGNNNEQRKNEPDLKIKYPMESTDKGVLMYRITNFAPLLFTSPDGDENMVCTLDHIPGSAVHGYYANQFIRERNLGPSRAHQDELFRSWFLEGKLRFSNAYPVCQDCNRPLYPTPLFLYTDKQENSIYNLLNKYEDEADKAISGYSAIIGNELHKKYGPKKVINFHLARNSSANVSASRIEGNVQEEGIFHYEAIKPGQEFHGYIYGTKADLELFQEIFAYNNNIRLGRSLNTQYGGARIEFDEVVDSYSNHRAFLPTIDEELSTVNLKDQVLLYLLSPLILSNRQGFYVTDEEGLIKYLQAKLDVPNIKIKKSFAKVETGQSFVSHLKIYEPGFRCYTAGSSFLLEICDSNGNPLNIDEELLAKLNRLMTEGIGEKRHLGYGRVEFYIHFPDTYAFYKHYEEKHSKPDGIVPVLVQDILENIYRDNLRRIVAAIAAKRADDFFRNNKGAKLSSNLLGRVDTICRNSENNEDFIAKIENLRDTAVKSLKDMKLANGCLYNDLISTNFEKIHLNGEFCNWLDSMRVESDTENHWGLMDKLANDLALKVTEEYKYLYKFFWRVFIQTMRKLQKKEKSRERGGKGNVS